MLAYSPATRKDCPEPASPATEKRSSQMNRRKILVLSPSAFALLVACGPSQATPEATSAAGRPTTAPAAAATTAPAANKPVMGGTLTAAMSRDATNFDPIAQNDVYSAVVLNQVVDTLYEVDKDGKVV